MADFIDKQATINVAGLTTDAINFNPTKYVDAQGNELVAVVRCKNCKHYYADPWGYGNCVFEGGVSRRTKETDFCSWGERKEDENL